MEKKYLLFSCAATLLLTHGWVACLTSSDESALLSIKSHFTFDPHSILASNWTNTTSYCHWFGVTCNTTPQLMQRVITLNLSNMGLQGTIAPHVGNLSLLEELYLASNHLTGEIPKEISNLGHLRILSFPFNNLAGSIPSSIFNISSLEIINLAYNSLSGTLPMDICNSLPKLERLLLPYNQLGGKILTSLHKCTQLKSIRLAVNAFTGGIPRGIGNLSKLEQLGLSYNILTGGIPKELGNLPNLELLDLGPNKLTGHIPTEIGNLSRLEYIDLGSNNLTGIIPPSFGNLTTLQILSLQFNTIQGVIPQELGNLLNLQYMDFTSNNLIGVMLEAIFNISTLQVLRFTSNYLTGNLPTSILANLEGLHLADNELGGKIPRSISNLSKLTELDLWGNYFTGYVPTDLGNLRLLQYLDLGYNELTNHPSDPELGFLTSLTYCKFLTGLIVEENPLNGMLPNSVANLSNTLASFHASSCQLTGIIPGGIGNLTNIISLRLGDNDLTGPMPTTLEHLWKLQGLVIEENQIHGAIPNDLCQLTHLHLLGLSSNKLSGPIPSCIGNLTALRKLFLDSNSLTSEIPVSLWKLRDLLVLNLSSNFLSSSLPLEVSIMRAIILLDMSNNQFSGNIPSTIGELQTLIGLNLSENKLQGPIPLTFGKLISLEYLDLSCNDLSGPIPKSLEDLKYLKFLNVSLNKLQGAIPSGGPFENFTTESFMSNDALCGETRFGVRPCNTGTSKQSRMAKLLLKYILPCISATAIIVVFVALLIRRWNKKTEIPLVTQTALPQPAAHMRISYQELVQATNYFSDEFLVGKGGMSMVYKGVLSDGLVVAVKVFNLQLQGALRSFDAECEVMRNIRHRNLVKVITSCSTPDFKALVLEYMPNGSLEKQLYSHNYCLDVVQRLSIMTDVASALVYLHHENPTPVLHCDLKPTNVLLDEDMVAHVADFGIAKLFMENESLAQTKTLGTIGYMAPEYGLEGIVSTRSDVYSYGIMLMETFTRKKPTDEMFSGEVNLRSWVESLANTVMEIVDTTMLTREDEHFAAKVNCISSILTLALECTTKSPEERISMKVVVARLKKIRIKLLAGTRLYSLVTPNH